jgi:heme exporter protein A
MMRLLIEDLACVRGDRRLFEGLAFTVTAGQAAIVTGPNGAGKSSLLRMIAGLLRPADGRVTLEGGEGDGSAGGSAHLVGHLDGVKGALTVQENLDFTRALLGGDSGATGAALPRLGLAKLATLPARMLSAGQRRRLALARLLVAKRPLWLLDEPMSALDAEGQEAFTSIAAEHLAGGGLVVVTTHAPLKLEHAQEIRLGGGGA